jgi:hypothetical protein
MPISHKSMIIDPRADGPSSLDGQWSAYCHITDIREEIITEFYITNRRYKTRQLALDAALLNGRRKVDELSTR